MKSLLKSAAALAFVATTASTPVAADAPVNWDSRSLTTIHGDPLPDDAVRGRVVLMVNTASRCAFTPQYEGLEEISDKYTGLGLTVLGVPSNDFGGQEPGTNEEIAQFCSATYGVSFPMLEKTKVTGGDAHPLYRWARDAGGRAAVPAWNFHKILIGRDGRFVAGFPSFTSPTSGQVTAAIERALATPAM